MASNAKNVSIWLRHHDTMVNAMHYYYRFVHVCAKMFPNETIMKKIVGINQTDKSMGC